MASAGSVIKSIQTSLVYRNSQLQVRSVNAYFPSVARLINGELLCTLATCCSSCRRWSIYKMPVCQGSLRQAAYFP
jgi:hypothetical protein